MEKIREIKLYKNYFLDFYGSLPEKTRDKIKDVLFMVSAADRIPAKFFQHLTGTEGLYEVRIEHHGNIYRIFSCFDQGKLIILFNGFQKKSQKTPVREIERALKIKADYFQDKTKLSKHGNQS